MSVLALLTGGTIGLRAVAAGDGMERVDVAREVLPSVVPGTDVAVVSEVVAPRSGAALTLRTILAVRARILAERGRHVGFLVRHEAGRARAAAGTDGALSAIGEGTRRGRSRPARTRWRSWPTRSTCCCRPRSPSR